jgi:hypothetical protein
MKEKRMKRGRKKNIKNSVCLHTELFARTIGTALLFLVFQ